jgi:hypothetical protein
MAANKIDIDKYVQFVEKGDSELYALKIIKGTYTDVIYTYGKVEIKGSVDQPVLKFDFIINEPSKGKRKKKLEKSKAFKTLIGDILVNLIEEKIDDKPATTDN